MKLNFRTSIKLFVVFLVLILLIAIACGRKPYKEV